MVYVKLIGMGDSWPTQCLSGKPAPAERECVAQDLRRAFPIPLSGCFDDLLQAIDKAERRAPR